MQTPRPYLQQGRRIRQAREARGWRQEDLGRAIHSDGYHRPVTKQAISKMEAGVENVPRKMRGPMTRVLTGLELDPLAEDDLDPALLRIAS